MVLAELTMFPTDKGESVSAYVAPLIDMIAKSDVSYQLTPMGTILEGSWTTVMEVITACFRYLEPECNRISVNIKIDYRAGDQSRLSSKMDKVEQILGRPIQRSC